MNQDTIRKLYKRYVQRYGDPDDQPPNNNKKSTNRKP